jgi:hypothetical protein
MSDDKLLNDRTEGARALILLQNEQFANAVETVKKSYAEKLFATPVDQPQQREILYNAYRIIPEVIAQLQYMIDNGKLADAELNRLIRLNETKKPWSAA